MMKWRYLAPLSVLMLGATLTSVSAQQAEPQANGYSARQVEMRLSQMEEQLRGMTGKIEQVDYMTRRMDQILRRMQEDYEIRFTELEKQNRQQASIPVKVSAPQDAQVIEGGAEEQVTVDPVTGTLGSMKMRDGKITGGSVSPKAPALPDKPEDYGLTAQELYDHAFGLLRQADYEKAEGAFKAFFEKHPKHKLVNNAKYWYAETFYVRGKYSDAAIAFAEAYQHSAKGAKAPDSLLKLAMSLGALDKKKDACGALTALKLKHPKAAKSIRKRAAQQRRKLKCK